MGGSVRYGTYLLSIFLYPAKSSNEAHSLYLQRPTPTPTPSWVCLICFLICRHNRSSSPSTHPNPEPPPFITSTLANFPSHHPDPKMSGVDGPAANHDGTSRYSSSPELSSPPCSPSDPGSPAARQLLRDQRDAQDSHIVGSAGGVVDERGKF